MHRTLHGQELPTGTLELVDASRVRVAGTLCDMESHTLFRQATTGTDQDSGASDCGVGGVAQAAARGYLMTKTTEEGEPIDVFVERRRCSG